MTTASQARQVIRARIEAAGLTANGSPLPLRFQNEEADSLGNVELPAEPAPFAYIEFANEGSRGGPASFGGGRGQNRYRNQARVEGFVFVRKGDGLAQAEQLAEQIAALFRSHRDDDISCFDASVYAGGDAAQLKPSGMGNAVDLGAYFYDAFDVSLFFDQIG